MKRVALFLVLSIVVSAIAVLCGAHADAWLQDRDAILAPSSTQHWAGTDDLGRDRVARLAVAVLVSSGGALVVAAVTTAMSLTAALGIVFSSKLLSWALQFFVDVSLTLPWLFLLLLIRSLLPLSLSGLQCGAVTMLLLASLGWPMHVRALYSRLHSIRNSDWFVHSRAAGLSDPKAVLRQVLPHLRSMYITQFLLCIPVAIISEADLGVLGFGLPQPLVSWGTLLQDLASSSQISATAWVYAPLVLLLIFLLSFELFTLEA